MRRQFVHWGSPPEPQNWGWSRFSRRYILPICFLMDSILAAMLGEEQANQQSAGKSVEDPHELQFNLDVVIQVFFSEEYVKGF